MNKLTIFLFLAIVSCNSKKQNKTTEIVVPIQRTYDTITLDNDYKMPYGFSGMIAGKDTDYYYERGQVIAKFPKPKTNEEKIIDRLDSILVILNKK